MQCTYEVNQENDISKMMILKGRRGVQREIHSNDEGIHSLSSLIDDGVE